MGKTIDQLKIETAKDILSKSIIDAEAAATNYKHANTSESRLAFHVGYLEGSIREVLRLLESYNKA
jgi:hypothetical protein